MPTKKKPSEHFHHGAKCLSCGRNDATIVTSTTDDLNFETNLRHDYCGYDQKLSIVIGKVLSKHLLGESTSFAISRSALTITTSMEDVGEKVAAVIIDITAFTNGYFSRIVHVHIGDVESTLCHICGKKNFVRNTIRVDCIRGHYSVGSIFFLVAFLKEAGFKIERENNDGDSIITVIDDSDIVDAPLAKIIWRTVEDRTLMALIISSRAITDSQVEKYKDLVKLMNDKLGDLYRIIPRKEN